MALPSSGPLSINDIAVEFGGSVPHSLSEYYGVATGIPASGTIAIDDFYGASAQRTVEIRAYGAAGGFGPTSQMKGLGGYTIWTGSISPGTEITIHAGQSGLTGQGGAASVAFVDGDLVAVGGGGGGGGREGRGGAGGGPNSNGGAGGGISAGAGGQYLSQTSASGGSSYGNHGSGTPGNSVSLPGIQAGEGRGGDGVYASTTARAIVPVVSTAFHGGAVGYGSGGGGGFGGGGGGSQTYSGGWVRGGGGGGGGFAKTSSGTNYTYVTHVGYSDAVSAGGSCHIYVEGNWVSSVYANQLTSYIVT